MDRRPALALRVRPPNLGERLHHLTWEEKVLQEVARKCQQAQVENDRTWKREHRG
ncbi:MAG: hypothetical protein IMX01_03400 [Limnochordaceae bacterium]|nr:hypothetical protein [Limnochordaceae bacterium]